MYDRFHGILVNCSSTKSWGDFILVRQNVTLPVKDAIFQYIEVGFIPGSDLPKKIASE